MTPEPVIPISAIEHFLYCPRQCALIHCDGVWSDNAHTARGTRAHRRVDGGQHRMERGRRVLRGIPLWSESLGLSGRADVVEMDGDAIRPVEYKSGVRHGITADLQLCAQALCLEEMLGVAVPSGSVWYGGPRRRVEVDFTDVLRNQVLVAIDAIRRQGWSRGNGVCDDFMKPCLSSSGCETRPAKGEPARPVASLAPETVTDSAKRRHASEWAVGR